MTRRRAAAIGSLLCGLVAIAAAVVVAVKGLPEGLLVLVCGAAMLPCAWHGLVRRGRARVAGLAAAAVLLAATVLLILAHGNLAEIVLVAAGLALTVALARAAFAVHEPLPAANPPPNPVLFMNPRSGGGKAERFALADEAAKRDIEAVTLGPDDDLEVLVRDAIARGAGGLAMAGGDGSQAIVATFASENDLPYACIPAGTRNHLALDLGVDRDDVVGALDAFSDGGERLVDLAEVNGRVFVNNVSLGVYAEAVQRESYRDAKLRTVLDTVPDALGPEGEPLELRWTEPGGRSDHTAAMVLVSNNEYRLGSPIGSGTRPTIDDGRLGVVVFKAPGEAGGPLRSPMRQLSVKRLQIDADGPVPAGIDGEAVVLDPPLRFSIRPRALRVRIASQHPGASPSAGAPADPWSAATKLAGIAAHGS